MRNDHFTIAELERRLSNLIRIGTIESVDAAAARCRVKIDDLITGPLPWQAAHAGMARSWSAPSVGEQVVILSPFGDFAQAVVIRSVYQASHPAPSSDPDKYITDYGDGTAVTYDAATHTLRVDCAGDVLIRAAGHVDLGDTGGAPVARVGDMVSVGAGSSAGSWPIVSGSALVRSI